MQGGERQLSANLPSLSGPERPPASGGPARSLVVLLHGVGADGGDLIDLASPWARLLPDGHFIAPNGPEPYDMAPFGYQWFSLKERSAAALLAGVQRARLLVDAFLDAQLARLSFDDSRLALVGFSQGTMTALYVAPRRAKAPAGVVGYSGALIGADRLATELRSKPPVLLVHGDVDPVVPVDALHAAAGALGAAGVPVEWHVSRGAGHGIDPEGLRLGGAFLSRMLQDGG